MHQSCSTYHFSILVITLALGLSLSACGAGERATVGTWAGAIDTLENGAIQIRNPSTGLWDEATAWRLEEELRIGSADSEGPDLFGNIADIAVDRHGRIYVLERQAQEIRVFDTDGSFLHTIGRRGGGPGEFQSADALRWGPDGHLWVVDPRNARYSVFDTTGAFLGMYHRRSGIHSLPWPGGIDARGRLTDIALGPLSGSGSGPSAVLVTYEFEDREPIPVDTIWIPEYDGGFFERQIDGGLTRVGIPFSPRLTWRYDPRGFFWSGISDRYRIVRQGLAGDTIQIIERDYRPVPVTAEERAEAIERLEWFTAQGGRVDLSRIPRTKAPFTGFFIDPEGYLWVKPSLPTSEEGLAWDIFDPQGYFLGTITADFVSSNHLPVIDGDRFYTVISGEFDIPYVVRARIVGREMNDE